MADYKISFARPARKELGKLPLATANRVLNRIEKLAGIPPPRGVTKIQGRQNLWRIRVGEYRVIFDIDDDAEKIDITHIRHRKDVYRDI